MVLVSVRVWKRDHRRSGGGQTLYHWSLNRHTRPWRLRSVHYCFLVTLSIQQRTIVPTNEPCLTLSMPSRVPTRVRLILFPWKLAQSKREGKSQAPREILYCYWNLFLVSLSIVFIVHCELIRSKGASFLSVVLNGWVRLRDENRALMLRGGEESVGAYP